MMRCADMKAACVQLVETSNHLLPPRLRRFEGTFCFLPARRLLFCAELVTFALERAARGTPTLSPGKIVFIHNWFAPGWRAKDLCDLDLTQETRTILQFGPARAGLCACVKHTHEAAAPIKHQTCPLTAAQPVNSHRFVNRKLNYTAPITSSRAEEPASRLTPPSASRLRTFCGVSKKPITTSAVGPLHMAAPVNLHFAPHHSRQL